jgi:hypothetical protein
MRPAADGINTKKKSGLGNHRFNRSFIDQYMIKHGSDIKQRQSYFSNQSEIGSKINNIDIKVQDYKRSSSTHDEDAHGNFTNAKIKPSKCYRII